MLPAFSEHLKATQTEKHRTTAEEHRHYLLVVVEEGGRVARNCSNGGNSCQRGNTSTVQLFDFENSKVRVVMIEGNPWFVAKDVCDALGLQPHPTNGSYQGHIRRLDDAEKMLVTGVEPTIPNRRFSALSESGLYKLVMRSDKPEAKRFQDWVTKTATYGKPDHQGIPRDAVRLP
ncbi:MAG TPA: hypothetical protein GXX56_02350 [Rhodocyclaceae bacterium]|nr:hypothetical protein [Rhodocyclaceae bacterium]